MTSPPAHILNTPEAERRGRVQRLRTMLDEVLHRRRGWRGLIGRFRTALSQEQDEVRLVYARPVPGLKLEGLGLLLDAASAAGAGPQTVRIAAQQIEVSPAEAAAPREGTLDFLVCERFFEQLSNPLGALRRHLAGLRAGGLAILTFQARGSEADAERGATTLEQLILDDVEPDRSATERIPRRALEQPLVEALLDEACRQSGLEPVCLLETGRQGAREYIAAACKRPAVAADREAALFAASRREGALLVLLHDVPFRIGAGGTECHTLDLLAHLKLKHAVLVYPSSARLISAALISGGDISRAVYCSFALREPVSEYMHRHAEAEEVLLYLARLCGARAVLIEHLRRWPLAAVGVFRRAGLPYVCVTNDFFAVCPNLNLFDPGTQRPCSAHSGAVCGAESCLRRFFEAQGLAAPCECKDLLQRHQALFGGILRDAEAVVFPSESAQQRVLASLPEAAGRARLIPHGYAQPERTPGDPQPRPDGPLRVALLGMLALPIKGSELIVELLSLTRDLPLEWHLFGAVDSGDFRARLEATGARLVLHGLYSRKDIIARLQAAAVDLALFTSVAEETFSYTLSEVWCAGVPAIVPRLGALGERVAKSGLGWLIQPHSAGAAGELLRELAQAPAQVLERRARLKGFRHLTLEENAAAYRELLHPLLQKAAQTREFPGGHLPRSLAETARWKAAFNAATRTVLLLDAHNQFAGVTAVEQASLTRQDGALVVEIRGHDPALGLPACAFVRGRRHLLRLDLSCPAEDELQVYYGTRATPHWSEDRSIKALVRQGHSEVFVELAAPDLAGPLRLDPGTRSGEWRIQAVEIRALPG